MPVLHCRSLIRPVQKAPCENAFRAIMNALQGSKACDITGIAGIACARHGCYAPNALVDLFKGEQQKNIDFAFLQALKTTGIDPQQGVMIIYDIACQYYVHLYDRIGQQLPTGLKVDRAIGLFHIHAHKDECFFRFASSFIPGAGVVIGEILESLWSSLNAISPTVCTATLTHRVELLDDHADDSNYKKTLGMAGTLCRRYFDASTMVAQTEKYFAKLSATAGMPAAQRWDDEVKAAEAVRLLDVSAMDVYAARVVDQVAYQDVPASLSPTSAAKEWISYALMVEDKQ
jgi:Kyakuja-Dileera-Zisupton transposase